MVRSAECTRLGRVQPEGLMERIETAVEEYAVEMALIIFAVLAVVGVLVELSRGFQ